MLALWILKDAYVMDFMCLCELADENKYKCKESTIIKV